MTTPSVQHNATLEFLNSSPEPKETGWVLDVGCGDGFAAAEFRRRGVHNVYAHDIVDETRPMLDENDIPFLDQSQIYSGEYDCAFSVIWCHHVLEHQDKPIEFLRGFHSLMCAKGELWVTVPNMIDNFNWSPGHTMAYNMVLLIEHLRLAGYDVENGSFFRQRGHLRVRLCKYAGKNRFSRYPDPMRLDLEKTGRARAELMHNWRWR